MRSLSLKKRETVATSQEERERFALSDGQIKQLASVAKRIERYYCDKFGWIYVDIEFAFEKETGKLYILQVRPEIYFSKKYNEVTPPTGPPTHSDLVGEEIKELREILGRGENALHGQVVGRIRITEDIKKIKDYREFQGAILVLTNADPAWTGLLNVVGGIITEVGGYTSHAALIARERGIPCIIGATGAIAEFKNLEGALVTLDTLNRRIYKGVAVPASPSAPVITSLIQQSIGSLSQNIDVAPENHVGEKIVSKEVTVDSVTTRNEATINALKNEEDAKSRDPIAIIGLPWWIARELKEKNINPEAYLATLEKEISRMHGAKGYGDPTNLNKFKLFFIEEDMVATKNNIQKVLDSKSISNRKPDQDVVIFVPQVGGSIDKAYLKSFGDRYTIIPDAYSDIDISNARGFPDVDARIAITRLIAWCKESESHKNVDAQTAALNALTDYLSALSGEQIPPVTGLRDLLRKIVLLRIRPVDYRDITGLLRNA